MTVLMVLGLSIPAAAQYGVWRMGAGPFGGNITAIEGSPTSINTLFVGTSGGLYRTSDSGMHWGLLTNGLPATKVSSVCISPMSPTTVLAATTIGVCRSQNNGDSWLIRSTAIDSTVTCLEAKANQLGVYYAGTETALYRTTSSGDSWTAAGNFPVYCLCFPSMNPSAGYAGSSNGVVRRLVGDSWAPVVLDASAGRILGITTDGTGTAYAATELRGIYCSKDNGATWTPLNLSGRTTCIAIHAGSLYAGTPASGAYRSQDGGTSWQAVGGSLMNRSVQAILSQGNVLWLGTGGGIMKSSGTTESWLPACTGILNMPVNAIAVKSGDSKVAYAATAGAGVFRTTDFGNTWQWVSSGLSGVFNAVVTDPRANANIVYAAGPGVFRSIDGGLSWSSVGAGLDAQSSINCLSVDPFNPTTLYAGTSRGRIFKTTNGGASWVALTDPGASELRAVVGEPRTAGKLYAVSADGRFFRSVDGGLSWIISGGGLPVGRNILSLAVHPSAPGIIYAAVAGAGLYKTTDSGESWINISSGIGSQDIRTVLASSAELGVLYVGLGDGGIWRSDDGGSTWGQVSQGTPPSGVSCLAEGKQSPVALYAGTLQRGTFYTSGSTHYHTSVGQVQVGWNLISLPGAPIDPNPAVVLSGIDLAKASLQFWDNAAANGRWIGYGSGWGGPMEVGHCYWFLETAAGKAIDYEGTPQTGTFSLSIPAGAFAPRWVMFGHPFNRPISCARIQVQAASQSAPISWSDAYRAHLMESKAIGYEASKFFTAGPGEYSPDRQSLEPWHGYWLLVSTSEALTLKIPDGN